MNSGRNLLIYLAILYDGNYDAILEAATKKLDPDFAEVNKAVESLKCNTLTLLDPNYPSYLKKLPRAPLVLFYYGDISLIDDEHHPYNLGVVGTRNPTEYGLFHTERIVYEVAKDCNIISGLAQGIDGQAHQAAIDAGAKTVAVIGSGIDNPWPTINIKLYHDIIKSGGLVVSEYPNMSPPLGPHFPVRNRLISMFSNALLVTQAFGAHTGTSITVGCSLSLGREVMCIPYPVNEIDSFCNQLIYEGAKLVRDGHDILVDMNLEPIKII
ncbi:MAG: DNA-protecting protein DprA [Bacilli bacterium]|nr:DNA-protecting protein DprA [Bacilli bacterium]